MGRTLRSSGPPGDAAPVHDDGKHWIAGDVESNPHPQKPEGAAPKAFVVCHGFVAMTRKDPPFKTKGGAPGEPFEGRFGRNDSFVVWVTL
jgi:hypothetical protein